MLIRIMVACLFMAACSSEPANLQVWTPQDHANVGKAFRRAVKHAGLPTHFSPHSLRHTYASLLLADGVSPAYVQEQLGHASIELTVGTYGRWLRKRAPGAVDRLDQLPDGNLPVTQAEQLERVASGSSDRRGSSLVANRRSGRKRSPQVVEGVGDPPGTRTPNLEIKSLLLYQLS